MAHRFILSSEDIEDFARFLGTLKLPVTVEWVQGRDRTLDQNALQWLWASEAAMQRGDETPAQVQARWKLTHGVPILREDSADFRAEYDSIIKPLPYHTKLRAMEHLDFGVTRRMKVRQMVRYLDAIWAEAAEQGLRLTAPDPELAKYQNSQRRAA